MSWSAASPVQSGNCQRAIFFVCSLVTYYVKSLRKDGETVVGKFTSNMGNRATPSLISCLPSYIKYIIRWYKVIYHTNVNHVHVPYVCNLYMCIYIIYIWYMYIAKWESSLKSSNQSLGISLIHYPHLTATSHALSRGLNDTSWAFWASCLGCFCKA
jgi:hypothetical protein